ncbi:MAG: hypothetical protein IT381_23045 [Deltaproteobacteria bacterium]|nr:hypothetical protein [Deltaproteobacteria bacterium]
MLELFVAASPIASLGAALLIALGCTRRTPERRVYVIALVPLLYASALAVALFVSVAGDPTPRDLRLARWIDRGKLTIDVGLYLDWLSAALFLLVSLAVTFAARFSRDYLHREAGYRRYFAVLALFHAAMSCAVLARDYLWLFVGWEIAGFCSYLLIGFFHDRPRAVRAATKAIVTKRIGDVAFLAAIALMATGSASVAFSDVHRSTLPPGLAAAIGACLLVAAAAKSAQLPFSAWVGNAVEGPTPSSALFYGGVMVSGGVYLLARSEPILPESVLVATAIVGGLTAFACTLVRMTLSDVKSQLAYTTAAQLGLMFVCIAFAAVPLAIVHLVANAVWQMRAFYFAPSALQTIESEPPGRQEPEPGGLWIGHGVIVLLASVPVFSAIVVRGGHAPPGYELSEMPRLAWMFACIVLCFILGLGFYLASFMRRRFDTRRPAHVAVAWGLLLAMTALALASVLVPVKAFAAWDNGSAPGIADEPLWALAVRSVLIVLLVADWSRAVQLLARPANPSRLYAAAHQRFWMDQVYARLFIEPLYVLARIVHRIDTRLVERLLGSARRETAPRPSREGSADEDGPRGDGFVGQSFTAAATMVKTLEGWLESALRDGVPLASSLVGARFARLDRVFAHPLAPLLLIAAVLLLVWVL